MNLEIKRAVKITYSSTGEFFRYLFGQWKGVQLLKEMEQGRREITEGRGKVLKSLRDLD